MFDEISANILAGEEKRQLEEMVLIASENYASKQVRMALSSLFTNKYSEGYPGKRYYAGQEFADKAEELAIERAKNLFNANFANVQPLSGAPANFAVYLALINPGDKIMGMDLSAGGHLTHGSKASFTSKIWQSVSYGINVNLGEIDYNLIETIALKEKPKILIAGFSSYPRTIDWKIIKEIGDKINAITMADIAHIAGFIAAKIFENPLDVGFDVVTTTTHKSLRGPRGGLILTNNKSTAEKIDRAIFPGLQGGPHMNNIIAKAISFWEAGQPSFKEYASQVLKNAKILAQKLMEEKVEVVTKGTDNHIVIFNCVKAFGIGGKEAQDILEKAGLSTNRNSIPDERRSLFDPSGIRLGTLAMTTRGFKEKEFEMTAEFIVDALKSRNDMDKINKIKKEVKEFCCKYLIP